MEEMKASNASGKGIDSDEVTLPKPLASKMKDKMWKGVQFRGATEDQAFGEDVNTNEYGDIKLSESSGQAQNEHPMHLILAESEPGQTIENSRHGIVLNKYKSFLETFRYIFGPAGCMRTVSLQKI